MCLWVCVCVCVDGGLGGEEVGVGCACGYACACVPRCLMNQWMAGWEVRRLGWGVPVCMRVGMRVRVCRGEV